MAKIYFGFDESNNNQIPEFEVLVFSPNVNYVRAPITKLIKGKKRKETFEDIEREMDDLDFKYIVIFKENLIKIKEIMIKYNLKETNLQKYKKAIILYSFFLNLKFENSNYDIFLDGYIGNTKQTKEVVSFLKENFPEINFLRCVQKGDEKLTIINFADRIAYQFFNENFKNEKEQFENSNSLFNKLYQKKIYLKIDEKIMNFMINNN